MKGGKEKPNPEFIRHMRKNKKKIKIPEYKEKSNVVVGSDIRKGFNIR